MYLLINACIKFLFVTIKMLNKTRESVVRQKYTNYNSLHQHFNIKFDFCSFCSSLCVIIAYPNR